LRFRGFDSERGLNLKNEKGREKGRSFFSKDRPREKPERSESPREHQIPTRTNPSGSKKEDGSTGGIKPLKRR
jgi:hypothetical protein